MPSFFAHSAYPCRHIMSHAGQEVITVEAPASFTSSMFRFIVSANTSHLPATSMGVPQQFSSLPRVTKSTPAASRSRTLAIPISCST